MINSFQSTPSLPGQVVPFTPPLPAAANLYAQQPMQVLRMESAATPARAAD
ncbi:MAG TPA: hypothetical protein PLE48_12440 [Thiobacillus sp.]|nr:hypothetical protein [Thiobacillus sp.]HQT71218.1 hypothetical protein [Thiobacillus sp.]